MVTRVNQRVRTSRNADRSNNVGSLVDLFTPSNLNLLEIEDFEEYKQKLFIETASKLFWGLAVIIGISWGLQYYIYADSPVLRKQAFFLRGWILSLLLLELVGLRTIEIVRKHAITTTCFGITMAYGIVGYYSGTMDTPGSLLSYAYFAPCIAILIPLRFYVRLLVTALFPLAYLLTFVATNRSALRGSDLTYELLTLTALGVICVVIGHMLFALIRRNFLHRRRTAEQQNELEYLATHDQLTGLFNRRFMEKRLNEEVKKAVMHDRDLAVLMMDIDHFKKINDNHGHQAGDNVLETIGRIITGVVDNDLRGGDIGARYGGEEFLLALPETNREEGVSIAEQLREELQKRTFESSDGQTFTVTCSVGVANLTEDTEEADQLVRVADDNLYQAKEEGRNRVIA